MHQKLPGLGTRPRLLLQRRARIHGREQGRVTQCGMQGRGGCRTPPAQAKRRAWLRCAWQGACMAREARCRSMARGMHGHSDSCQCAAGEDHRHAHLIPPFVNLPFAEPLLFNPQPLTLQQHNSMPDTNQAQTQFRAGSTCKHPHLHGHQHHTHPRRTRSSCCWCRCSRRPRPPYLTPGRCSHPKPQSQCLRSSHDVARLPAHKKGTRLQ